MLSNVSHCLKNREGGGVDESSDVTSKTSETPLTETLESATEMLQTSVSGAAAGGVGKDFLGYYDFTDIFNTAQCDLFLHFFRSKSGNSSRHCMKEPGSGSRPCMEC